LQAQFPAAKVWAAQTERDPINWVAQRRTSRDSEG
jgi:hypothetical protein